MTSYLMTGKEQTAVYVLSSVRFLSHVSFSILPGKRAVSIYNFVVTRLLKPFPLSLKDLSFESTTFSYSFRVL